MNNDRIQVTPVDENVEVVAPKEMLDDYTSNEQQQQQKPWQSRLVSCAFCTIVFIGLATGLGYYFGVPDGINIPFLPNGTIPFFEENDGFNGEDAHRWDNGGAGGLSLRVLNALDASWQASFDRSIQEWENGSPDALRLTAIKVSVDPDCSPVDYHLKVCNGDYGKTNWWGINALLIQHGFIANSAAKMNDFLLNRASAERRQYTMCHEIGHGFGLPHTDENFYNRNRGECMDYTQFPGSNQQPGRANFEFLSQMYGTIPSETTTTTATSPSVPENTETAPGNDKKEEKKKNNKNRRLLRRRRRRLQATPERTLKEFVDVVNAIQNGDLEDAVVETNPHTRTYSVELRDGYSVEVNMLLVAP